MPYIGNTPALDYISYAVQNFTVTAGTTSYALDYPVANENDIRLVINNVIQRPGASYAYSATGTTLTLTSATLATDTMYAVFIGRAVQTVNPPNSSVTNDSIVNGTINLTTKVTGVLPVANGGTGLSALGTSLQVLRTNTGATALEFATISSTSNVKAWVNFNGVGTPSIRASLNVSSISDNGGADYSVNFTTALADADYAVAGDGAVGTTLDPGQYNRGPTLCGQTLSSSSFRFRTSQLWTTSPEELAIITYIVTR